MSDDKKSSGGIGFCGALAILFIGLKLGHVIDWSWIWVLSPIWIPIAFVILLIIILILAGLIMGIIE
jgi:hypothetical protein